MKDKNKTFSIWQYVKRYKFLTMGYFLFLGLSMLFEFLVLIYGAKFLEVVTTGGFSEAFLILIKLSAYCLLGVFAGHFSVIFYTRLYNNITNAVSVDVSYQVLKISDKAYSDYGTGVFTQRISSDPSIVFHRINAIINLLFGTIESAFVIFYIFLHDYRVGLILILGICISAFIYIIKRNVFSKNIKKLMKLRESSTSILNEIVRSEKDIKSLNLEGQLKENVKEKLKSAATQDVKTITVDRYFITLARVLCYLIEFAILTLGLWLYNHAVITLAVFMFIYSNKNSARLFGNNLMQIINHITEIKISKKRIQELYEDDEFELEHFGNKKLKNVKGFIEFKNVDFAYNVYKEKTNDEIEQEEKYNKKHKIKDKVQKRVLVGENKVIENMNFKIEPNTTVAFVGKSGSGKTTVLQLISKMYECKKGEVLIDNVNINDLNKETIRSSIALVNQFPYIFDMTIKENLLLAKHDSTDEEINLAIKNSALDEFIATLPDGLNTKVGEGGIKLSGGQKQRLAIARALLRKTPIIIFDESTSSLDNIAQSQVKKSIDNIKGQSTVIIVAHRLSTIRNVDKIFFLDKGKIVDEGNFNDLFETNKDFKEIFLAENIE